MPRPGIRPYECVRRAWHSERHLPIRGSLIQEIFRVVSEIHSSAIKRNKEWQEKLPIVVLKTEEIMYSKANSEAEYLDLKTLWDRANDAINTIIRRDENTETGDLLQPCIEAALNVGCTPRRASRSQRNSMTCYLSSITPDSTCVPSSNLENATQGNHATNSLFMPHPNFMKPTTMNATHIGLESCSPIVQNKSGIPNRFFRVPENFTPGDDQFSTMKTYPSSSVHPLYYGHFLQPKESEFGFVVPSESKSHPIKPGETGVMPNISSCNEDDSNKIIRADVRDSPENPTGIVCDLSLRLGPVVVPCASTKNSLAQELEDVGSNNSREGNKFSVLSVQMDKDFSFFPKVNADDPLDSYSSRWSSESEILNIESRLRKRKAVVSNPSEDRKFCWRPKVPFNQFTGRMSNAGS